MFNYRILVCGEIILVYIQVDTSVDIKISTLFAATNGTTSENYKRNTVTTYGL